MEPNIDTKVYDNAIVLPNLFCIYCHKKTPNKFGCLEIISNTYYDKLITICLLCHHTKKTFLLINRD